VVLPAVEVNGGLGGALRIGGDGFQVDDQPPVVALAAEVRGRLDLHGAVDVHQRQVVTIADAEIRRCPRCGYFEVVIPRLDALHRAIAAEVIRKPARLSGSEFVFLRSQLEMSARALAKTIGVVHESISRWENDVLPVSSPVDRLMRTMVALTISGEKFSVEALSHIEGEAGPLKLVVTVVRKGLGGAPLRKNRRRKRAPPACSAAILKASSSVPWQPKKDPQQAISPARTRMSPSTCLRS
jgi:putative zinc finger/helix-turn-helix YgiT family protein